MASSATMAMMMGIQILLPPRTAVPSLTSPLCAAPCSWHFARVHMHHCHDSKLGQLQRGAARRGGMQCGRLIKWNDLWLLLLMLNDLF